VSCSACVLHCLHCILHILFGLLVHASLVSVVQAAEPATPHSPSNPPLQGLPPLNLTNEQLKAKIIGLRQLAPHLASSTALEGQLDRF